MSVLRRSEVLDRPRPRHDDHTTWTATAPEAVFLVRTYGTGRDYEPGLVRKFSFREQQTSSPQARSTGSRRILP
jgi:hypothetical protein